MQVLAPCAFTRQHRAFPQHQAVAVAQACEVRKVLEHQAPLCRKVLMLQPCPTSQGCPSPAVRCVWVDLALISLFAGLLQPPACAAALCCTSKRAAAFISSPCCGSVWEPGGTEVLTGRKGNGESECELLLLLIIILMKKLPKIKDFQINYS